ncbi:MAG: hypothetical protein GX284_07015 [Clostridiales bacterium]|nr:hypothetical protein [Clostridiales bacterium]
MKKLFEGILVLILIFSLTGCSNGHTPSTDSDNSKAIYESTISPNEEYIEKDEDKVFYTIKVYQEDTGIKVASSSNSAFCKDMSYEIKTTDKITKDDIDVQWQTLMGDTNYSKENQLAIAVVTISLNGEIISERKVSFVGNTIDIIIDTIEQN